MAVLTNGCRRAHPLIKNIIHDSFKLSGKAETEGKVMQGMGEIRYRVPLCYWPHLDTGRTKTKKVVVWKTSGVQIIIKLKAVMNRITQAFLLDSFNMETGQLCDFLEHSLCNTFGILSLQAFPRNISLSHIPTSFRWYPSKPKSWKQIRRLSPSTWALNNSPLPGLKKSQGSLVFRALYFFLA